MKLDIEYIRKQFPAFDQKALMGQAFFENAGGSYTCKPVIDRLTRYYNERKVQPYAPYEASKLAGEEMDEARERLALILGVVSFCLVHGCIQAPDRGYGQLNILKAKGF